MSDEATTEAPAETAAEPAATVEGAAEQQQTAAPAAKPPSEVVRLVRETKRLQARIAELEARGQQQPAQGERPVTRAAVLAELRELYAKDPEAFLNETAGEDFYAMANRIKERTTPVEETVEELRERLKRVEEHKEAVEAEKQASAKRAKQAETEKHVAEVAKMIDATDANGDPVYPVLSTLDESALDEPPALTAYNAVTYAWIKECCKLDANGEPITDANGKVQVLKTWTDDEVQAKFKGAFDALEQHYGKLRSPRPKTPPTQDPESATIEQRHAPGPVRQPERPSNGTMSPEVALRMALKEHGFA